MTKAVHSTFVAARSWPRHSAARQTMLTTSDSPTPTFSSTSTPEAYQARCLWRYTLRMRVRATPWG